MSRNYTPIGIDNWLWNAHFHKLYVREYRKKIEKLNNREVLKKMRWMDGYDGPSPYPKSQLSNISEYAIKFGGTYRASPNPEQEYY